MIILGRHPNRKDRKFIIQEINPARQLSRSRISSHNRVIDRTFPRSMIYQDNFINPGRSENFIYTSFYRPNFLALKFTVLHSAKNQTLFQLNHHSRKVILRLFRHQSIVTLYKMAFADRKGKKKAA